MAQLDNVSLGLRAVEQPALAAEQENGGLRFPELLILFAKRKRFILKFVVIVTGLALMVSLLFPTTYTADARIMPPQQNQSMSSMALLSQLGPLGVLAGQGVGLRNPSDLYVAMLRSDSVANDLIDRFSLMSVYDKKLHIDARRILEDRTEIAAGKDGVISVSVEDRESFWFSRASTRNASRERAAALANGYVAALEKLTKTLAVTEAAKRRAFFEAETKMASDDLAGAELALKQTQEKTGLILMDPQSRAIIESVTSLRARVTTQEVIVQSMKSFATAENPDLVRAENELAALRNQLAKVEGGGDGRSFGDVPIEHIPAAGLEYYRRLREVKYREALFELLAKQYETAKIDEAKDALVVQQLDVAAPPERKSGPHYAIILGIVGIVAFLLAGLAVFYLEGLEQAKGDPRFSARVQLFRFYLRGRGKRLALDHPDPDA
jgi:uncharacterized protein involved in exopolysaccharide biosynthesis